MFGVEEIDHLGASYGKVDDVSFLSPCLTFSGFLAAYGFSRFKLLETWPIADEVFTHVPFFHGIHPMYYVAFMTICFDYVIGDHGIGC